ncbi:MAG: hypothetical protein JNJ57_14740 [Saprospiraceae bacterium]|nr:hypothetical protein [Saprospiraceae bacterium]
MDKKLHDDRLDDYVKKSFEEYEENPSGDMWSRIEGALPPAEIPKQKPAFWYRYRWQMAAAVVILLLVSRLICVQSYYEEKLRLAGNPSIPGAIIPPAPTVKSNEEQSKTQQPAQNQPPVQTESLPSNGLKSFNAVQQPESVSKVILPTADNSPETQQTEILSPSAPVVINQSLTPVSQPAAQASLSFGTFEELPEPQLTPLLFQSSPAQPLAVQASIKPFKTRTGWYLGLAFTPNLIVEKQQTIRRPGLRPRFTNHQERPQPSVDLSLRIGKKLNRRFAIETGIGYQQLSKTATHNPKFEYREGHLMQGGNMGERSFEYDLNTYGGSAEVSLRTEVAGMSAPGENDRVGATIQSTESIQLIKVPLSVVGRFGQSRLQAVVRGGLVGNFITKNEFEITASQIDNPRLRFRVGDAYKVQFNNPNRFVLGYQLAGGVEFHLNKKLSIAAMPALSGDFARTDAQGSKLPGHTTFGVNVGANWWF